MLCIIIMSETITEYETTPAQPPQPENKQIFVIFCVPGRQFSNKFLLSWNEVFSKMIYSGKYKVALSNAYSSQVNFARAQCLHCNVLDGPDQMPFKGKLDYDVLFWLDSDMVFNFEMVEHLILNCYHNFPVVSGLYALDGGQQLCCVENWDYEYYIKNGGFEFLTNEKRKELLDSGNEWLKCAYTGMGCMAIRKGVLEDSRLKYPWFFSNIRRIDVIHPTIPYVTDGTSEDVSFIRNLIENGIIDGVMVSLAAKFGHEKSIVY